MVPVCPAQHQWPQYAQFSTHLCLQLQHPLPQRPQLSLGLCLAQARGQHRVLQRVGVAAPRGLLPAPPRTARLHPEGTGCWDKGPRWWDKGIGVARGAQGVGTRDPGGQKGTQAVG